MPKSEDWGNSIAEQLLTIEEEKEEIYVQS
jgi:hypothetical protein